MIWGANVVQHVLLMYKEEEKGKKKIFQKMSKSLLSCATSHIMGVVSFYKLVYGRYWLINK